jgi:hypothetical protein
MSKLRQCLGSILFLVVALAVPVGAAQISGTWNIRTVAADAEVELTFHSPRSRQNNFEVSQRTELAQLQGLNARQVNSTAGALTHFSLHRPAGTLHCEGYVKQGEGAGTFVFDPDPGFVPAMNAAGISDTDENQLLAMAVYDISPAYVQSLKAAGVEVSSSRDLIAMRIFRITPEYVRDFRALGYPVPAPRELIKLRIFNVDPAEIQGFRRAGYTPTVGQLVKATMFHVTSQFATQLSQLGYGQLSIDEMVRLRIFNVTPDYVRSLQSHGLSHLKIDQLVKMRMFGID